MKRVNEAGRKRRGDEEGRKNGVKEDWGKD